ncbi:expressed unknown protein [Seminavis robusta]|uniref:Uncharacterized protein n=1 Tax=Seminavis robusta TaxID=568900 RepID=A0A9N8H1M0_9STRA|nr:expressed unknown protein [Seminavis robusta]|eukprot:Sro43_g026380.1 n/a (178) ;mRNA; f:139096-139629
MPPSAPRRSQQQVNEDFLRVMMELRLVLRTEDIPEKLLVLMVGYKNTASTGYLKAKSHHRKANRIQVSKGIVRLTEAGIEAGPDVDPPRDNREIQARIKELVKQKKGVPSDKLDIVFDILLDGQMHSKAELLEAAHYKHPSSTGFLKIMSAMKELGLTEGDSKSVKFTKIVFPFADP